MILTFKNFKEFLMVMIHFFATVLHRRLHPSVLQKFNKMLFFGVRFWLSLSLF